MMFASFCGSCFPAHKNADGKAALQRSTAKRRDVQKSEYPLASLPEKRNHYNIHTYLAPRTSERRSTLSSRKTEGSTWTRALIKDIARRRSLPRLKATVAA